MESLIPNQKRMTSLEIAEVTGKQHAHVMRDIRNLLSQGVAESNFGLGSYTDANGQERPLFNLTPKGCLILASGYDAVLREKIIGRLEYLENEKKAIRTPQTYLEALEALVASEKEKEQLRIESEQQQETIELQQKELTQSAPKVEYCDKVLSSKGYLTINMIAACLGISDIKLNKLLCQWGIQYKESGVYYLYSKYRDKGYTVHRPHAYTDSLGNIKTRQHMYWTEAGKKFIIELYNSKVAA